MCKMTDNMSDLHKIRGVKILHLLRNCRKKQNTLVFEIYHKYTMYIKIGLQDKL